MKLLTVVGLSTIGLAVAGTLTIGMMQDNTNEPLEVVQSPNEVTSINDNQEPSTNQELTSTNVDQTVDDLVIQNAPVNKPTSNIITLNDNQEPLADKEPSANKKLASTNANQAIDDLVVVLDAPVNKQPTSNVIVLNDNQEPLANKKPSVNQEPSANKELVITNVKAVDDLIVQNAPVNKSTSNVTTQKVAVVSLYGNQDQPGNTIHQAINDLTIQGTPLKVSIPNVIDQIIANEGTIVLSPIPLTSVKENKDTVLAFMANMLETNDLFATTKLSIENNPEDISNIMNVGVVLYPDLAQEVINAAVLTGEIDSNDALLAAIGAGADPTTVSEATAAGGVVANPGLPFAGLGGGGSGDQEASASVN